jgi:AcrR family transcriptional regulator
MATPRRVYGGIDGDRRAAERRDKLLAAGLDMLGSTEPNPTLTVRGVCRNAGLVARYFYENFDDGDALVVAVYEEVIGEVVTTTLAALAKAGPDELQRLRVGLGTILDLIGEDPRKGRLLFNAAVTHPALAMKRLETARMFGGLLAEQSQSFYRIGASGALQTVSRFLVGGLGETLTAWLHGDVEMTRDELIELCAGIFQSSARLVTSRKPQN